MQANSMEMPHSRPPQEILEILSLKGDEAVLDIGYGKKQPPLSIERRLPHGHIASLDGSFLQPTVKEDLLEIEAMGPFDVITSFYCFQWFSDPESLLTWMAESLKPGGKCLLAAIPQESEYLQLLQTALRDPRSRCEEKGLRRWPSFTIEDYRQEMQKVGFEILHFEVVRSIKTFPTLKELADDTKRWADRHLSQKVSSTFLEILGEHVGQDCLDPESETILIPSRTLIIFAEKKQ
jgi:trans-aconitate methyltransferase